MKFKRLKQLRVKNDYTQKIIAKYLNSKQSNYSKWVNGKETIPLEKLILLSKHYDLSIDYLTGLTNSQNKNNIEKLDKFKIGKNIKELCKENNITQKKLPKY